MGLKKTELAKDRKAHLLNCWLHNAPAETKFMVTTTVGPEDEWLHAFYYFNDEIPTDTDFEKTIADYLTFEFSMIMQGRGYLFEYDSQVDWRVTLSLTDREWKEFEIGDLFSVKIGKNVDGNKVDKQSGKTAYVTRKEEQNGLNGFIDFNRDY